MVLISLLGLFLGAYLTLYKFGFIGALACNVSSCEKVQSSRWSMFLGLPVATWGLGFYAGMLGLAFAGLQKWDEAEAAMREAIATSGGAPYNMAMLGYVLGRAGRRAEAEAAAVRRQIRAEVLDAAARLDTATARIDAARAAREAAEVQLDAERQRFAVGLSTNFLVLTRQNDLARARLDEIAAATDRRAARIELGRATGALLEERGIEVTGPDSAS